MKSDLGLKNRLLGSLDEFIMREWGVYLGFEIYLRFEKFNVHSHS